jgi:hypothetical protein
MAEKIKINLSNGQKKSSDEQQFLKASRNWEKCSALGVLRDSHNLFLTAKGEFE